MQYAIETDPRKGGSLMTALYALAAMIVWFLLGCVVAGALKRVHDLMPADEGCWHYVVVLWPMALVVWAIALTVYWVYRLFRLGAKFYRFCIRGFTAEVK